jgi:DNA replication protein DnaC
METLTWRQETKFCAECGKEYEAKIPVVNGEEKAYPLYCRDCTQKRRDDERRQAAFEELNRTKEIQRDLWFEDCNVPVKFASKTFSNFDSRLQPKAYTAVKAMAEAYCRNGVDNLRSLVLLSPDTYGVGKTHLCAALVNHVLESVEPAYFRKNSLTVVRRPLPVYFITEVELVARIRATFSFSTNHTGDETGETILEKLISYDLLVLDDCGKVQPRDPTFLQGVLFRLIDGRYARELPILLTTNLDYTELEAHIGGASADRLREMCGDNFVRMTGKSYRLGLSKG